MILNFLFYLSWIVLPISTIWACMCIYFSYTYYDSKEELRDKLQGVERTFPLKTPALLVLLSSTYLLTYYGQ